MKNCLDVLGILSLVVPWARTCQQAYCSCVSMGSIRVELQFSPAFVLPSSGAVQLTWGGGDSVHFKWLHTKKNI